MNKDKNHTAPLDKPGLKQPVFNVPEGYFDGLKSRILEEAEIKSSELEQNDHLKTPVFETPTGYFDGLERSIENAIDAHESELSSNEHLKQPVFSVPENYFSNLETTLTSGVTTEQPSARVIPLYQRNWFKMAIAAMLVVGFFLVRGEWTRTSPGAFEGLSNETMLDYLYEQTDADLELIAAIDGFDSAIDQILEEETASYDFDLGLNPELEYDFEYLEQ